MPWPDLKAWADVGIRNSTSDPGSGTVLPAKKILAAGCTRPHPAPRKIRQPRSSASNGSQAESAKSREESGSSLSGNPIVTASAATVLVLTAIRTPTPRVVWNSSPSVPIGLYRVDRTSKIMVNDLVIAIPPEPVPALLASRGYLPRGVPLIKRVLALAGQAVCREGLMIRVDCDKIGMAQARDSIGPAFTRVRRLSGHQRR
jgi:type IV secretory pathway protease TraF